MLCAMTHADVLADLERALAATEAVVADVRADQWVVPTPCSELDAHGVLNHLVRGNLLFIAIIGDQPRPEPGADHLPGAGRVQEEPHGPATGSRRALRRGGPGFAGRTRGGPAGRVPRPARTLTPAGLNAPGL